MNTNNFYILNDFQPNILIAYSYLIFNKIYDILNLLLISGIRYNDYNINNFIVENVTDNVYIIDFEDTTKVTMYESMSGFELTLRFSKMQIKNMLLESIYNNQIYSNM